MYYYVSMYRCVLLLSELIPVIFVALACCCSFYACSFIHAIMRRSRSVSGCS